MNATRTREERGGQVDRTDWLPEFSAIFSRSGARDVLSPGDNFPLHPTHAFLITISQMQMPRNKYK